MLPPTYYALTVEAARREMETQLRGSGPLPAGPEPKRRVPAITALRRGLAMALMRAGEAIAGAELIIRPVAAHQ